jgi:hypothetical protein
MKKHIIIVEELKRWVDLLEIIRKNHPKHAEYLSRNLVIDGKKEKLIYLGSLEAIANILESSLSNANKEER